MTRRIALVLALVLGLAVGAHADPSSQQSEQIQGILKLMQRGVSEDVIVKHIAASRFAFDLTSDDILELRDQGLSDRVIEAMLDTAAQPPDSLQQEPQQDRVYTRDNSTPTSSDVYLNLSAGYYSPWYQYPYAWGSYYDPFLASYSLFYYPPFFFNASWGWYGSCHYYYPTYWGHHGWQDPYYWRSVAPRSCFVSVPRVPVNHWDAGRGLGHGRPGVVARSAQVAVRQGQPMTTPRLTHAWDRDRVYMRRSHAGQPANGSYRRGSNQVFVPDPGRQQAPPTFAPREGARHLYRSVPSTSPPRESTPAFLPHGSAAPAGNYTALSRGFASAPRAGSPAGAPAFAPRGSFGASAPRHR